MAQKQYRTMTGKLVELDQLVMRNETVVAVGNARVNARGDELGPGGEIVKKREDVMNDYHSRPDAAVHQQKPSKTVVEEKVEPIIEQPVSTAAKVEKPRSQTQKSTDTVEKESEVK
jgi:hypothetical protein